MRALVRKYPDNVDKESKEEVMVETDFPDWVNRVTGQPLTEEPYYYALCENVPDVVPESISPEHFTIEKHTKEIIDEFGEKKIVTYYLAEYIAN